MRFTEPKLPRAEYLHIPGSNRFTRAADERSSHRGAVGLILSFVAMAIVCVVLAVTGVISHEAMIVGLWSLLGLYFAFGILIATYRIISKFE